MNSYTQAFHLTEKQYNNLFNNSLNAIIVFDSHGIILQINPAAISLFGFQKNELLGHSITLLGFSSCSDKRCLLHERMPPFTLCSHVMQNCELTAISKNHNVLSLRANITELKSNKIKGIFSAIFQDMSEQKKTEKALLLKNLSLENEIETRTQQLKKARNQAEQANTAKSNFLANMSHELRTPLHGILSFSNMGVQRTHLLTTKKITHYFELISYSGERLLHLLNELLDLSKIDSHGILLEIEPTDFQNCVKNCINEQQVAINAKGLLTMIDNQMENCRINIDKYRINQIISNLLSNAIKFSFPDQLIEIKLEQGQLNNPNDALKFSIKNQGQTIPEEEHESIFERFSQSSREASGTRGAGLGLTISREIATLHCGLLYSLPNRVEGACFELLLPIDLKTNHSS